MEAPLLIVGGGVAGLSAALTAARTGTPVVVVEKEDKPGGFAAQYCCKATDSCAYCGACIADEILREAGENESVQMRLGTTVDSVESSSGAFKVKLSGPGEELDARAVILATGFEPFDPKAQRSATALAEHPDIVSAIEIERMLREQGQVVRPSDSKAPEKVAFIQCVGSRSRRFGSPECSRVCCPYAIRIARRIKWQQPDCELAVFHMDLQGIRKVAVDMYGQFAEEIDFIRGIPAEAVKGPNGGVALKYELTDTGQTKQDEYDIVVLSVGISPRPDAEAVGASFGVGLDSMGFLKPRSLLEPCTSGAQGVFLAGTCSGPKDIRDSVAQGRAAAQAALNWIQGKDG